MWQERPRRIEGQNESASVWQGFCVAQYGWQVHPDQTKAVKGQNSKTLVTAGAIKRPLPCPGRGSKTEYILRSEKKKQSKKKRKKIRKKTEKKRKETKKKEGVSSMGMHQ